MALEIINVAAITQNKSSGASNVVLSQSYSLGLIKNCTVKVFSVAEFGFEVNGIKIHSADNLIEYCLYSKNKKIVVFHGVWLPIYWRMAFKLYLKDINYAVFPHGSLTKKSFNSSIVQKIICLLPLHFYIKNSRFLHFLNESERSHSFYQKKTSICQNNGVSFNFYPQKENLLVKKRFVFIGRLDVYHKGLDLLVKAISRIHKEIKTSGYEIYILGDNYRGGGQKLVSLVKALNLEDVIKVKAERLSIDEVIESMELAKGFLHTSRYEGEPLAVLQSIYFNLPVLVTEETNCSEIIAKTKSGLVVASSIESISKGLLKFIDAIESGGFEMESREFVNERTWEKVALQTFEKYNKECGSYE